jgi:hypothetical protein
MTTLLRSDIELVSSGVNKGDVIFLFFLKVALMAGRKQEQKEDIFVILEDEEKTPAPAL